MYEGPNRLPKRKSQEQPEVGSEAERAQLIQDIRKMEDVPLPLLRASTSWTRS